MKSISRLWNAFGTLAASLEGLATLIDTVSGQLRQRLALESPAELEAPAELAQLPAPGENAAPEPGTEGAEGTSTATTLPTPRRKKAS